MNLSARAYRPTLKLARTTPARATAGERVADLIGAAPAAIAPGCFAKRIETAHLAEAIHLRPAAVAGVGLQLGYENKLAP